MFYNLHMLPSKSQENFNPAFSPKCILCPKGYLPIISDIQTPTTMKFYKTQDSFEAQLKKKRIMAGSSSSSTGPLSKSGCPEYDEKLLQPYLYITGIPREKVIANLIGAFNQWLNIPVDKLKEIEDMAYMVYNATLLFDDINENANIRRGIPSAHSVYGLAATINAGNYILYIVMERILDFHKPETVILYNQQILQLYRGQGMALYHRENTECPSEQEYEEIATKKKSSLLVLTVKLMQAFSTSKLNFMKLVELISYSLQIIEDCKSLLTENYSRPTGASEDLVEIRYSYPVVFAIQNTGDKVQITQIMRRRPQNVEVKKYLVKMLDKNGSLKHTKTKLAKLQAEIKQEITKLGGNILLEEVIDFHFNEVESLIKVDS